MDEEYVLITASEYRNLLNSEDELTALDCMGVDNWCGYGEVDWNDVERLAENNEKVISNMPKYNSKGEKVIENN